MSKNEKLAEFIVGATWESLPEAVRERSRMCLMDNLSATLSGGLARVSRIAADYAAGQNNYAAEQNYDTGQNIIGTPTIGTSAIDSPNIGAPSIGISSIGAPAIGTSTILLEGRKATPALAAFANASAANALDSDDGLRYAYGHAGAQLFPVALALSEARRLNGAKLLAAMIAGYEVAARIGRCWHDHHSIYQACGSWGSVASAAAAANLMELGTRQTLHALGIAEFYAPNAPMMRDIDDPAMVKHGIGWGAMTGIISADLASAGFTGIPSIAGFDKYQKWMEDIGTVYHTLDGIGWKKRGYACCSWAHAAMEGARNLVDEHHISIEDIEIVRVYGFHETVRLGTKLPSTTEEAQFNLAWPVASIIVDGEVGPLQMLEDRLKDPLIKSLARKIELVESKELNELHQLLKSGDKRGKFAGRVEIFLKDGRCVDSGIVDAGVGFPQPGWDREVMEDKFRLLAGFVLDEGRIDQLIDMIWRFEKIEDLSEFINLLTTPPAPTMSTTSTTPAAPTISTTSTTPAAPTISTTSTTPATPTIPNIPKQ